MVLPATDAGLDVYGLPAGVVVPPVSEVQTEQRTRPEVGAGIDLAIVVALRHRLTVTEKGQRIRIEMTSNVASEAWNGTVGCCSGRRLDGRTGKTGRGQRPEDQV